MYRVVIADDEEIIRSGLKKLIESYNLDLHIIAMAEDGKEAIAAIEKFRPEIILMDINMPLANGLEVIERVRQVDKDAKIIIISGYNEFAYAQKAMEAYSNRIWEKSLLKETTGDRNPPDDIGNLAKITSKRTSPTVIYLSTLLQKSTLSANLMSPASSNRKLE